MAVTYALVMQLNIFLVTVLALSVLLIVQLTELKTPTERGARTWALKKLKDHLKSENERSNLQPLKKLALCLESDNKKAIILPTC